MRASSQSSPEFNRSLLLEEITTMAESSPPVWLGTCLNNRYDIRKELGKAFGRRTFLADDRQEQCPVVIKVITFGDDFEWTNLRLFEREAEVLKSLSHDDIPSYLDYFEIDLPYAKAML